MSVLICGSLAFDTITTFPGRFAQQILPEQVHILNVSFLVPSLRKEFGGCAGNIAYSLKQLGGEPLIMATLGKDGALYRNHLEQMGVSLQHVRTTTTPPRPSSSRTRTTTRSPPSTPAPWARPTA